MWIKKIEIQNFRGIKKYLGECSIEFGGKLTVLDGENGFGKTTIFDAIEFCLTGTVRRFGLLSGENQPETILKHEEHLSEESFVKTYFFDDGREHVIARRILSEQRGQIKNEVYEVTEGLEFLEMLNITQDNFKDIFYIPQTDSISLLGSSRDGIKKFFDKLCNTESETEFRNNYLNGKNGAPLAIQNLINLITKESLRVNGEAEKCENRLKEFRNENIESDIHFREIVILRDFNWYGGGGRKYAAGDFDIANPSSISRRWNEVLKLFLSKESAHNFYVNDSVRKFTKSLESVAAKAGEFMNYETSISKLTSYEENLLATDHDRFSTYLASLKKLEKGEEELVSIEKLFPFLNEYRDDLACPFYRELNEIELKFQAELTSIRNKNAEERKYYQVFSSLVSFWEDAYANAPIDLKITKRGEALAEDLCPLCATPGTKSSIAQQIAYLKEAANVRQNSKHLGFKALYSGVLFDKIDKVVTDLKVRIDKISSARRLYASEDYKRFKLLLANHGVESDVIQIQLNEIVSGDIEGANRSLIAGVRNRLDKSRLPEGADFDGEDFDNYSEAFLSIFGKQYNINVAAQYLGALSEESIVANILFFQNEHRKLLNLEFVKLQKELPILKKEVRFYEMRLNFLKTTKQLLEDYSNGIAEGIRGYKIAKVADISLPVYVFTQRLVKKYDGMSVYLTENSIKIIGKMGNHNPLFSLSSGQAEGLMIAVMLANNINQKFSTLDTIFIDDPIQSLDDLNILSFVNLLKYQFGDRQIVISTHDDDFSELVRYKFWRRFGDGSQRSVDMKLQFLSMGAVASA